MNVEEFLFKRTSVGLINAFGFFVHCSQACCKRMCIWTSEIYLLLITGSQMCSYDLLISNILLFPQ